MFLQTRKYPYLSYSHNCNSFVALRADVIPGASRLTLNLLTTTIVAPPSNASKWKMGFNSAFKGLKGAIHSQLNGAILLCDVILDGKN